MPQPKPLGEILRRPSRDASPEPAVEIPKAAAHLDAEFRRQLSRTRVVIVEETFVVEGVLTHHKEMRVSDALNAATSRENAYIALSDAVVTRIDDGAVVLASNFLAVPHHRVLLLMPESEILSQAENRRGVADRRADDAAPPEEERRAGDDRRAVAASPVVREILTRLRK
jgi:hypothetical protein